MTEDATVEGDGKGAVATSNRGAVQENQSVAGIKLSLSPEERRNQVKVFLARKRMASPLQKKAQRKFEVELEKSIELEKERKKLELLQGLKDVYEMEKDAATCVFKRSTKYSKKTIAAHLRGEWTGEYPLSRGKAPRRKKLGGKGPKPLDEIEKRYPHVLLKR
eukprot:g582.t1